MCKTKLEIKDKHLLIDFTKRGVLVCKYEPGTNKVILVAATTGIVSNPKFKAIVLYTALNESDLWKEMDFIIHDFDIFRDEITMKN